MDLPGLQMLSKYETNFTLPKFANFGSVVKIIFASYLHTC